MSGNSFRGHMHLWYFKHVLYPSNFWFSKFIAGKLGRQVIFILPFVFSLTIQHDNFNYRVFWFFFKFFLIMMCIVTISRSTCIQDIIYSVFIHCIYVHVKLLSNALRTHRFVERVTQRILHEFKNSNWNVKNRHHAGPVHETLVPTPTTTTHPHTDTDTH